MSFPVLTRRAARCGLSAEGQDEHGFCMQGRLLVQFNICHYKRSVGDVSVVLPKIAIVGRPNVGKSSLFNVLARRRIAIVDARAGITRDRVSAHVEVDGLEVELIDTGGMGIEDVDDLTGEVERQIAIAMEEADLILFVVDVREGVAPLDEYVAERVRRAEKPVILVANKADNPRIATGAGEFHILGCGAPVATSTSHSRGVGELKERLVAELPRLGMPEERPARAAGLKIAIVGKRNAGKSTLVNHLAGHARVIVSEVPGTTRDSVDVPFEYDGGRFVAIDTAGLRRSRSVKEAVDFYSISRTRSSIRRADVVLLLIDCTSKVSAVDKKLASFVVEETKPVVIVVNKYDLAGGVEPESFREYIDDNLKGMVFAPMVFISARTGFNVPAVLQVAEEVAAQASTRVGTGELNRLVREMFQQRRPPRYSGSVPKIYYATQTGVAPVTIVFFVSNPKAFTANYMRYMQNFLRRELPFKEVPLRLLLRESGRQRGEGSRRGAKSTQHPRSSRRR